MKDNPYEWMNYTPTISNEFIEQCENPNFEKLKKDIQIAKAKDYLRDNDTKDGSEPCLERRLNMKELIKEIHENAKAHGWWEEERTFGELIALCHSELSEALEEYRDSKPMIYFIGEKSTFPQYESCKEIITDMTKWKNEKPEGIAIELADVIIRIFDMCGKYGIDIEEAIKIKHEYNKTRPYKHGGKVI